MLFNSLLMKVMIFLALSCHSPNAIILSKFLYVPSGPTLFFQRFSAAILKGGIQNYNCISDSYRGGAPWDFLELPKKLDLIFAVTCKLPYVPS